MSLKAVGEAKNGAAAPAEVADGWWTASDGNWNPPDDAYFALAERALAESGAHPDPIPRRLLPTKVRDSSRRARILLAAAAVVVIGGAIFVVTNSESSGHNPSPAHAVDPTVSSPARAVDPTVSYVAAVRVGLSGPVLKTSSDSDLIGLGRGVCDKLTFKTASQFEADFLEAAGPKFTRADALAVMDPATTYLCPLYHGGVAGLPKP